MTDYYIMERVGKSRYVLNFHQGKFHADGSKFYDIAIFSIKRALNQFIKDN